MSRRAWFVSACLVVLFVAALFLRAYWNLDAANPSEGEFVLSGGSDPYYHKRAADAIQENGFRHHLADPLLNYPAGSENPNPPFYEWVIAAGGQMMAPFFGGDVTEATWQAAIWSPAIFGALTLFPIYALGAALFDRRVGLVAALLWVVSTSAIDAGGVGLADHDSTVVFFATLAFLFYIQAIRHFRGDGHWIAKWGDGGAIGRGFGNLFRERSTGFLYAMLAGVSIAAVALTWKGFNYVLGILLIYAGIQLVVDHFRSRDGTGLYLGTLVATGLGVLLALPYYTSANVANFLTPTWYLLGFFLVAGAVLVVTRDLPSILVLPAMVVLAILGVVAAFFVLPNVAQSLLYATVYIKQTRLYETIAEAHPADFSTMAFGIGPVAFLLALAGWFILLFRVAARPVQAWIATASFLTLALVAYVFASQVGDGATALPIVGVILLSWLLVMFSLGDTPVGRTHAFAILWAAIALFMAASAVRFLINAIPVFAVFAAFSTIWVLDWLDFGAIRKSLAANRGNFWQGLRKGTRPLHIVAVILIALLFVVPTTILAADAALPPEAEDELARGTDSEFAQRFFTQRLGAYGGGFGSVKPWIAPLEWLDAQNANITDTAERPGFLAWWDYGHWAISIGNTPAVADNFQNGYEFAANFILAQNEAAAIQLLAARTAEAPGADLEAALRAAGSADPAADAVLIRSWQQANLTVAQSATLLATLEDQTGKSIRYFAADIRMLPYDNPQTSSIDQSSIFYAPVRLKGEEVDEYVSTKINIGVADRTAADGFVTLERYEELARDPIRQVTALGERFDYQDKFFDSMYWRAYVGTDVQPATQGEPILGSEVENALGNPRPAVGMEHFRVVYVGEIQRLYKGGDPAAAESYLYYPGVMIVEYYPGAIVEGTVTEEGTPIAGATVTVFDDAGKLLADAFQSGVDPANFNVPHAQATTGADGSFRIVAPFALPGGNVTLDASRGGVSVGTTSIAITREQANAQETISGVSITVARGSVDGVAFNDADGNGVYDAANETPVGGVNLTIGDVTVTTGTDGRYSATDVSAGLQNVTTSSATHQVVLATNRVRVQPGTNVTLNVALEAKSATVSGKVLADLNEDGNATDDEVVEFQTLTFAADATVPGNTARNVTAFSETGGNLSIQLRPGTYAVSADYTNDTRTFRLTQTIVVQAGETLADQRFVMTRVAE